MTYRQHVLVAWGGTLCGTEIWSNSVRMVPDASPLGNGEDIGDLAPDLAADLAVLYGQSLFHTGNRLEYVKVNVIGTDGKYFFPNVANTYFLPNPVTGTGGNAMPPQVSCVATLLTDAQRGLGSKGRIFFGGLARTFFETLPTDGRITAANRDLFATEVGNLLTRLNNTPGLDAFGPGTDVSVVSKGRPGVEGPGRKVTGVRVGRVLDTMRSRRNNLVEDYGPIAPVT